MVVVGALVLAAAAWAFLFRLPSDGLWSRTWVAAIGLSAYALFGLARSGDLRTALGPVGVVPVATGLGVGVAWLVATHVGHSVLCRIFPSFLDRVSELYALRSGDRIATMVGPVTAMGVAEELLFRGTLQGRIGLVGAVAAYTAVQLVTANWALTVAALLGGVIWGSLAWWQGGLLAPVLAHLVWTDALTFVWPLRGCGRRRDAADAGPLAGIADGAAGSCDGSPLAPDLTHPSAG